MTAAPTYTGSGDPALAGAPTTTPVWLDDLADDVTLEASAMDGAAQGPGRGSLDHPGRQVAVRVPGDRLRRRLRRHGLHRGLHDCRSGGEPLRRGTGVDHPQRRGADPAHRGESAALATLSAAGCRACWARSSLAPRNGQYFAASA